MIRLLGACLVIVSTSGIGLYFSMMTKGRVADLKALKKNIFLLRGDIRYGNTPLPEAIEILGIRSKDHFKEFFSVVAKQLKSLSGDTFTEIWDKAIRETLKTSFISENDKEQLRKLGETLGFMDQDMQIKSIDLYIEQLETELMEAIRTQKEKTHLYNMLGVLCGIFITIVLL